MLQPAGLPTDVLLAQVVAVMAMMVLIGTLADRLVFARIERRVRMRFGLA